MHKTPFFVIALVLTLGINSAYAADAKLCIPAIPADAQLSAYPYADAPLSVGQMATLGLKPVRLRFPFEALNFHRDTKACGGGRWVLETLPVGELVLVNDKGYVAYRVSCGNRLVWAGKPAPKPAPPVVAPPTPTPTPLWRRTWNWMWRPIGWWYTAIEVRPNGGNVEVTAGDIHVKADGNAVVTIVR